MSKVHITVQQTVDIAAELKETLMVSSQNPRQVYYKEGFSDAIIAARHKLHSNHVGRIRRELYGELIKMPRPEPEDPIMARVIALEEAVALLARTVRELAS